MSVTQRLTLLRLSCIALAAAATLLQAANDVLDFSGGGGSFLCQVAHFIGHYGEAAALISGTGGFDRSVQGQQVCGLSAMARMTSRTLPICSDC